MDVWSTEQGVMASDRRSLLDNAQGNIQDDVPEEDPKVAYPGSATDSTSEDAEVTLYTRRWYILVLFSFLCSMQGGVWNTWGPLSDASERAFGWSDADIALLSNWGPITYIISTPFFAWLMDVKGLRAAALVTGVLVAGGTGLRCITSSNPAATWLIHCGQILNGLGGPVAMGAAPLMSAHWFPAHQRTTATALMAVFNGFGVAVSFIIGPLLVPDRNSTTSHNVSHSLASNGSQYDIEHTKRDIMKLMYIEFGTCAAILLLIIVYFPNKPPKPPSITASVDRVDFKAGALQLLRHRGFWILAAPYAVSGGVYACWGSVLDVNLKPLGVSQNKAGWLGFYSTLVGNFAGLVIARFADVFKKRMKLYMLVMFSVAVVVFTVFAFACQGFLPLADGLLYSCLLIGAICISGVAPLFYELSCEITYPIAEGITNSLLTWFNNVSGFIFLLVLMIPNIGQAWMNWFLMGCVAICIPMLCAVRERYTRLDIDTQQG